MKFISLLFVFASAAFAGGFSGVFDAGWSTAYQRQDSLTKMHARLHSLGMTEVILQYGIVDGTHRYYDSKLLFGASGTTTYKNYHLFDYSLAAAKAAGNHLWLGLYYNGTDWYTPPTMAELDTLAARNVKVIDELYTLSGTNDVIRGVYIPQEIALLLGRAPQRRYGGVPRGTFSKTCHGCCAGEGLEGDGGAFLQRESGDPRRASDFF